MLVRSRPQPPPMQGMEGFFGDVLHGVVKVALLPITLPIDVTKEVVKVGTGAIKTTIATAKEIASGLRPPPPPPPPTGVSDAFGIGAGGALAPASSASSSNLPLIIGGVALVALIGVAIVIHKKRKR
jgi:hypothetical protein